MIVGEIGRYADSWEADAHLWCSLQRFSRLRMWRTYTEYIRVFSSPIDPSMPQTGHRLWASTLPLSAIPDGVKSRVSRFMNGKLPVGRYFGLEFFGDCDESSSIPHGAPELVGSSNQCYYAPPAGVVPVRLSWSSGSNIMQASMGILGGIALVGVALGLWTLYRAHR
jgi:hypothetical protein